MQRRNFLKLLGLVLVGVGLGPCVEARAIEASEKAGTAKGSAKGSAKDALDGKGADLLSLRRERLVRDIRKALGRPYRWGAAGPRAFDCSGLIFWLYARAGIRIPRTARQQGSVGLRVRSNPAFGDVLLFRSKASPSGWHTGLYLGREYFVHAAGRKKGVIVSPLSGYRRRLVSVRRYLVQGSASAGTGETKDRKQATRVSARKERA